MLKKPVNMYNDLIERKIPDCQEKLRIKTKILSFNKPSVNHLDDNNRLLKINSKLFHEYLHLLEKKAIQFNKANSQIYQNNNAQGVSFTSYNNNNNHPRNHSTQKTERRTGKCFKAAIKKIIEPFTRSKSNNKSLYPMRYQKSLRLSEDSSSWYKNSKLLNGLIENEPSIEKTTEMNLYLNQINKLYSQFTKKSKYDWNKSLICQENQFCLGKYDQSLLNQQGQVKEIEKNKSMPLNFSLSKNIFQNKSTNNIFSPLKLTKSNTKLKVILNKREIPPLFTNINQIGKYHIYTMFDLYDERQEDINTYYSQCLKINLSIKNNNEYNYIINKSYRDHFEEYFQHRINWTMVNMDCKQINFQWKYFSRNVNYRKCVYNPSLPSKKQMMVNLFENNNEVGNKRNFFINLVKYCNTININPFEIIPFTVIISNGRLFDLAIASLEELITYLNRYSKNSNNNLLDNKNKGIYLNRLYIDHFINDYFNSNDKTPIYIPLSYISTKNYWILKPIDLYKGIGIQICDNIVDIKKLAKKILIGVDTSYKISDKNDNIEKEDIDDEEEEEEEKGKQSHIYCSSQLIVQKYLDHPLLYQHRKFDIRCFVLVDHNLNVFYCREGHLKGCSVKYDLESSLCPFAHITNYSFQKHSQDFEKYEDGNEMSYQNFKDFLQSQHISLMYFDLMIQRMKFSIEISMNSIGSKLYKKAKTLSFEIFGYDFIIDKNFMPWILEINNNPGLGISSPVIAKIVPRMIDDAFRLTIDTVFETKYSATVIDPETMEYKSKYHVDGYSDIENIFEFLCNINKPPPI